MSLLVTLGLSLTARCHYCHMLLRCVEVNFFISDNCAQSFDRDTLRIFTSTLYGKTKTNTNPDPNRNRRHCPDPNAMIQKKEVQIKTEEYGNCKAEKYKIEIEVNILNTTR